MQIEGKRNKAPGGRTRTYSRQAWEAQSPLRGENSYEGVQKEYTTLRTKNSGNTLTIVSGGERRWGKAIRSPKENSQKIRSKEEEKGWEEMRLRS